MFDVNTDDIIVADMEELIKESSEEGERLNKYLALRLGISRREADDMIAEGRVLVEGETVKLGRRILPGEQIKLDGELVDAKKDFVYLVMNKPVGYVSSRKAQGEGVKTLYELLPKKYHELKTVGRLDKESSGLILLTNDGDFTYRMTHPKFRKVKIYEVRLNKDLEPLHQQMIADFGVTLADGKSQLGLERMNDGRWRVMMSEGRNRQIRRTFRALGYEVMDLHRTNFGVWELDEMGDGEFREVEIK
ncbi:pseudouridine synthase [Candidatus Saccharibacteria bacterium]|nr:pseudouridine synthase [Candidatus Saccharibacteria bacterium]